MCAQVVMAVSQSSSIPVEVGVKHGCVLAPIIFILFLVAMTLVFHRDLQSSDRVGIIIIIIIMVIFKCYFSGELIALS